MLNIFEIDMTLKQIEADPARHRQGAWGVRIYDQNGDMCGTGMCAAGFTVVRHGYELLFEPGEQTTERCLAPDGAVENIAHAAQRILGLNWRAAQVFFDGNNTLDDLKRMRDDFAAMAGWINERAGR